MYCMIQWSCFRENFGEPFRLLMDPDSFQVGRLLRLKTNQNALLSDRQIDLFSSQLKRFSLKKDLKN